MSVPTRMTDDLGFSPHILDLFSDYLDQTSFGASDTTSTFSPTVIFDSLKQLPFREISQGFGYGLTAFLAGHTVSHNCVNLRAAYFLYEVYLGHVLIEGSQAVGNQIADFCENLTAQS